MTRSLSAALVAGSLALAPFSSLAQSSFTKIDVDPTVVGSSSSPRGMEVREYVFGTHRLAEAAGGWFFTAHSNATGRELYFTDGTAAGTLLVKDIRVGAADSFISEAVELGGKLLFAAWDGTHGTELWISDGTAAGTQLLVDLEPGSMGTSPTRLTRVGQQVFFRAERAATGSELYRTDGTAAGTALLFQADDGVHGAELWTSDGTAGGTHLVRDLEPGSSGGGFVRPVLLGASIVFTAETYSEGVELFITDGSSAGTQLLADLEVGSFGSTPFLTAAGAGGGKLYFRATTMATGPELFVTDGTSAGTGLVVDALPGIDGSMPSPLAVLPAGLLVGMNLDPVNVGTELYLVSGSTVSLVKDLAPGTETLGTTVHAKSGLPKNALVQGNTAYFDAADGLWASDGTSSGTQLVMASTTSADQRLTRIGGGSLLFAGADLTYGEELFVTDGSAAGTHLFIDLAAAQESFGAEPKNFARVGADDLYFASTKFGVGPVVHHWSQVAGLTEIASAQASGLRADPTKPIAIPAWLGDSADTFLFLDIDPFAPDLFHTDGTAAGTTELVDLGDGAIASLGATQELLFLSVVDPAHGRELWVTDGTALGTQMVMDINPGPTGSSLSAAGVVGDKLYFAGNDGVHGTELWVSDGTAAGTHLVADINPSGGSAPSEFASFDGQLLFIARDGAHGVEPWTSDGTAAGTVMLADLGPGAATSRPVSFNTEGGVAYFFADGDLVGGRELWQTDGTPAGTLQAANIENQNVQRVSSVFFEGALYFEASDALHGTELWSFDGTTAAMVVDLTPGPDNGHAFSFVAAGDQLYFVGSTPATGFEMYATDGTALGTHLVGDLVPGAGASAPSHLMLMAGGLMFTATGPDGDRELYRYELPHAHAIDLGYGGSAGTLSVTSPEVGQTFVATVADAPLGSIGVIGASAPAAPTADLMMSGNAAWLDLASLSILGASMASHWSAAVAIPAGPAFVGFEVNLQAWFLPAGLLPAESSNGYRLVIGN